jgi:hypothetical protein
MSEPSPQNAPPGAKGSPGDKRELHVPAADSNRAMRAYLAKLLTFIAMGLLLMATAAVWAWHRYARDFVDTTRFIPDAGGP